MGPRVWASPGAMQRGVRFLQDSTEHSSSPAHQLLVLSSPSPLGILLSLPDYLELQLVEQPVLELYLPYDAQPAQSLDRREG